MGLPPANSAIHRVLADNIRRIRKQRGLTQEILAETAGVNQTHVGNIENVRNSPSVEIIHRLALALGVPISKLFGGEENQPTIGNREPEALSPLDRLNELLPYLRQYQRLASEFGIGDIFQDNGGKLLQTLIITRLRNLPGSTGNDAQDEQGNEYELKTVNRSLTAAFSTHHHLSPAVLSKYRQVNWIFCVYAGIEVVELYLVRPQALEPYFSAWEARWEPAAGGGGRHLNNPKIPIKFVQKVGRLIYKESADGRIAPSSELARWHAEE
ncbi:transcriptional regulator with XRE-family HTH domain [Hymenobacter sp. UYAg731]